MLPKLAVPLAVVCHDAGAANLVFAWLREMARAGADISQWRMCLDGPALKLWQLEPITGVHLYTCLKDALDGACTLLSGTGWSSSLEHTARTFAAQRGVRSIAAIDHWVNYLSRFERKGQLCLPGEIWVGDEFALAEARRTLPEVSVRQMPNLYLAECTSLILPISAQNELLYVLEPIRANWAGPEGGEFAALDFFAKHIDSIAQGEAMSVRLRPHPSDESGKYDAWITAHPQVFAILDDSPTLCEAIGRSRVVCGAETFAMVVALKAGRRVWSTLPPHAHYCRLPHTGILHLREVVDASVGNVK
jgi:hypothetical protein